MATQNSPITVYTEEELEVLAAELEAVYKKPFVRYNAEVWLTSGDSTLYIQGQIGNQKISWVSELKRYLLNAPLEAMPLLINDEISAVKVREERRYKLV